MENNNWVFRLLKKYTTGSASPEEKEYLDQYYQSFAGENDVLSQYSDRQRQEIETRMEKKISHQIREERSKSIRRRIQLTSVAATFLVLVSLTWLYFKYLPKENIELKEQLSVPMQYVEAQLDPVNVYLPDGSIVYLNKGSQLSYPSIFEDSLRMVNLSGEAYFDIVHNESAAFVVQSGEIRTRVLGTAFNVRALEGESEIEVSVTRGKVAVSDSNESFATLLPNQAVSYDKITKTHVQHEVNTVADVLDWKPSEYKLENMSMDDVVEFIERRWDYNVELSHPSLSERIVSATFFEEDQVEDLLFVLCTVINAEYNIDNNKITIYDNTKTTRVK
ncbi:FecR family protein [Membranihabitans marinus]|uniref:FecR family protein n=1 Tax=Membranihabitans marinus TaxID=1227546 RepID=UPI001F279085|nr:FecR domain-containing protein [Membranihabitans marinus]